MFASDALGVEFQPDYVRKKKKKKIKKHVCWQKGSKRTVFASDCLRKSKYLTNVVKTKFIPPVGYFKWLFDEFMLVFR